MTRLHADFEARKATALSLLESRGVKQSSGQPLLFRFAWWLGFELPPPHYASFALVAIINGAYFFSVWGIAMWISIWSKEPSGWFVYLTTSVLGGAIFGVATALGFRSERRKLNLPSWANTASAMRTEA